MFGKKAEKFGIASLLVVGLVVYLAVTMLGDKEQSVTPPTDTDGDSVVTGDCDCNTAPSLTPLARQKWAEGTSIAANFMYKVNDGPYQMGSSGTQITGLIKGATIEYLFNHTAYTDVHGELTLGCGEQQVKGVMADALDADADVRVNVINSDDNDLNALTNNQSLGANEVAELDFNLKPATEKEGKDCLVTFDYNVSAYDKVELSGVPIKATPSFITVSNTANVIKTFDVGTLSNGEEKEYTLKLDVKSAAPTNTGAQAITYYINCADWWTNTDSSGFEFGYENQDGTEVVDGTASTMTGVIYVE